MELEVRVVGGIESCFVSLPLSFIQTLQSTTSAAVLPPVLALELRSPNHDLWHVAWSGSASTSSAIEVAQQLAECILLPNRMIVQVKAIANLPKATLVMIEPNNEDDWEVLELNSDLAEEAILKQVGIVHEGMEFPLWLHGHTVVFFVLSTSPKKIVQLVPGTEVAVAPKRRKANMHPYHDLHAQASDKEQSTKKALLRVQGPDIKVVHRHEVNGVDLNIVLTSAAFIHPETAKHSMLSNLQSVIIFPRLLPRENKNNKNNFMRKSRAKEGNLGVLTDKEPSRHTIVYLLLSESVAKGHVILPQALRLYLGAGLHSWVYVKGYNVYPQKDTPLLTLSPCRFKLFVKDNTVKENGLSLLESRKNVRTKKMSPGTNLFADAGTIDWSVHKEVVSALISESPKYEVEEATSKSDTVKGLHNLLHAWLIGQTEAIASNTGVDVCSLVLGNLNLLHFEVNGHTFGSNGPSELLYLLTTVESSHIGQHGAYKIDLKDENKGTDTLRPLELSFAKLDLGDPIYFDSVKEKTFEKSFSSTISSLSWMGTATSDVIDRLRLLLSPTSGKLFSVYNLPLPGHVLIYGPPGSGKTVLMTAVAKYLEEHEEILAHIVFVSCARLALEKVPAIQQALVGYICEALDHSPSLVIFDDLDSVISSSNDSEGSQPSISIAALVEFLTDIMDDYGEKRQSSCRLGPIAFMASVQTLGKLPQSLSSSGRFDFHVQLPSPAVSQRGAILKHEVYKRSLQCSEEILTDIATKCDGYDAYDLEILVDRTVHAAVGRFLSSHTDFEHHEKPVLVREDFSQAMHDFLPVAMRDVTKSASEGGRTGWEDVGGLIHIQNAIQEMVELPSKFPNIFAQAPLRLRSNVLLYGPPGCGKTHIVGAAAAACSLRFISIKGPELLNKYIGASEQAV